MEIAGKWLLEPSTFHWLKHLETQHCEMLQDFVQLLPEVQLKGIRGKYPALEEALNAMDKVVSWIHRERWEVEQSQLAQG
ncbi:UNVERIFIED_CONTAM: hypothetical protein FKN15_056921 [Acipenser sinensis]